MVCGGTLYGGRRRRRSVKKTRKMKGGAYGFGGALDGGTNGALWTKMDNLAANAETGALIPNNLELNAIKLGGGRRRRTGKGKKVTRKGRKGGRRHKTMRGGATQLVSSNGGAAFLGTGYGGLGNYGGYSVNQPGGGPQIGADGVSRTT